jgi:DNA-3-methyladenine glycosylase I
MKDYKAIFEQLEISLRRQSSLTEQVFRERLDKFKHFEGRQLSDNEYYWIMAYIVFYSGFQASTVTAKLDLIRSYFPDYEMVATYGSRKVGEILNDKNMIRNERKVKACIKNAQTLKAIVAEYGSLDAYIASFDPTQSFENLMLLKEELEYRFAYFGKITVYHFLTDIGMPVLKPDRIVTRIFRRLGLIESEKQLLKTVLLGRKFSEATALPVRYIDIVFATYGGVGGDREFGIANGICLEKNPNCAVCGLQNYCDHYAKYLRLSEIAAEA